MKPQISSAPSRSSPGSDDRDRLRSWFVSGLIAQVLLLVLLMGVSTHAAQPLADGADRWVGRTEYYGTGPARLGGAGTTPHRTGTQHPDRAGFVFIIGTGCRRAPGGGSGVQSCPSAMACCCTSGRVIARRCTCWRVHQTQQSACCPPRKKCSNRSCRISALPGFPLLGR